MLDAHDHRRVVEVILATDYFCVAPENYEAQGWDELEYSEDARGEGCFEAILF